MPQPSLKLNDGRAMPQVGFGTWTVPDGEAPAVVGAAIAAGYRSIDTAAMYGNEAGVGEAIRNGPVPRDHLFVTTKLWNDRHGFDDARRALEESLRRLELDAVDLYLIHWPAPGRDRYVDTWRALVALRREGRARSIGVSNFTASHLRRIIGETGMAPAVNQIELHPRFQQAPLRAFHQEHGIVTESWSPLGRGRLLDEPTILDLAARHGKTPAQVILRWHVENGLVVIPKSSTRSRLAENLALFDFSLTEDDMSRLARLDRPDGRGGPDPDGFG